MKRIYSVLLASLLMLVGLNASAFTLNISIDDPSRIAEITTYPAQSGKVNFSSGKCSVTFSDDGGLRYVYVRPAQGKYIMTWKLEDEDGVVLDSREVFRASQLSVQIPATADYGMLTVTTADELKADSKVTVNLTGDPEKVSLSLNAKRNVELKEGENIVEYVSATEGGTIYVMPVGVASLYRVAKNGSVIEPTAGYGQMLQYNVQFQNGDVIDIETNYPDIKYACTIDVPAGMEELISRVTVDGKRVDDWANMQVQAGATLEVFTSDDYTVTSFTVNGKQMVYHEDWSGRDIWSGSWSTIVTGEQTVVVQATAIERNYVLYTRTYGWENVVNRENMQGGGDIDIPMPMQANTRAGSEPKALYSFYRNNYKALTLPIGEGRVKFGDIDNPFTLSITPYSDTANPTIIVQLNGENQEDEWGVYTLTVKDGDVLSIFYDVDPANVGTGIDNATAAQPQGATYSLQGVKMADGVQLPAGIYVKDGKKIVVK